MAFHGLTWGLQVLHISQLRSLLLGAIAGLLMVALAQCVVVMVCICSVVAAAQLHGGIFIGVGDSLYA